MRDAGGKVVPYTDQGESALSAPGTHRTEGDITFQGKSIGTVAIYVSDINVRRQLQAELLKTAGATAVVILLLAFTTFLISRLLVSRPLAQMGSAIDRIAQGDLSKGVVIRSRDELGDLAQAINNMVARLSAMVLQIREAARVLTGSSEQISVNAQSLSEGAQSQASTLEETSAVGGGAQRLGGPGLRPCPVPGFRGQPGLRLDGAGAEIHPSSLTQPGGDLGAGRELGRKIQGRRPGGKPGGGQHHPHRRGLGEDRRHRDRDLRDRGPDQPPLPECLHRGGAGGRARAGVRRGGGRGEQARRPLLVLRQGNRGPDQGEREERGQGSGDRQRVQGAMEQIRDLLSEGTGDDHGAVALHRAAGDGDQGDGGGPGQRQRDEPRASPWPPWSRARTPSRWPWRWRA